MNRGIVLIKIIIAFFVIAIMIFAATQSYEVEAGFAMGGVALIYAIKEFFEIRGNVKTLRE